MKLATNVKAKKKKGTYDSKIIMYISIGLGVIVAVTLITFLIVKSVTGFVGKVDGTKIYDYELRYFLRTELSEEQQENFEEPDNFSSLTAEEQDKLYAEFWTDERQQECLTRALEEARKFKAMYNIALEKGYGLTSTQKATIKSNLDSTLNYYYSSYSQYYGYTYDQVVNMFCGGMTVAQYKDFSIINATIENYKNYLKEGYAPTEEELRAIYDENPDDYRKIDVRLLKYSLPTKPTEPAVPKDSAGNEISADTENADDKKKYDEYLEKKKEYDEKLEKYEKDLEEIKTRANTILDALNSTGKYTEAEIDEKTGEPKVDENGKPVYKYENADLDTIAQKESDESNSSSTKGLHSINNSNLYGVDEIDEYALSMQWKDDKREEIISVPKEDNKDDKGEDNKEDGGDENSASSSTESDSDEKEEEKKPMTAVTLIETETAIYLVRCEGITDYDNSKPSSETSDDSIKGTIKTKKLEEMAVAELEDMIEAAGNQYAVKGKKDDDIQAILKEFNL